MNYFFTSDWHLNNRNIIRYCSRPFLKEGDLNDKGEWISKEIAKQRTEEMNDTIISRFNERVKKEDTIIYVGDFIFKSGSGRGEGETDKAISFFNKLNCQNFIWIEGNHDRKGRNSLRTIIQNIVINYGGKKVFVIHNPEFVNTYYNFCICGHVHEKWQFKRIRRGEKFIDCCNVSVDSWNFYPVTWQEIDREYHKWLNKNNLK